MTRESIGQLLEQLLGSSRQAIVLEDGARIFAPTESDYSVSGH
jgi:hypothetical protein